MKTKIYFLATTLLLLFSCDKAEVNYTEVELIVSSELLFAIDPISTIETSYLQVKEIGAKTDYWLNIYGIKGFEAGNGAYGNGEKRHRFRRICRYRRSRGRACPYFTALRQVYKAPS